MVVVGGGGVAVRKCISLIRCNASVTVVAIRLSESMKRLLCRGWINHIEREYLPGDLNGCVLAFAATDSPEVNRVVANDASLSSIPVNVSDNPGISSFTSPAVVRRGNLTLTVASEGNTPALSRNIRRELARTYGREYALTVQLLGAIREKLLTQNIKRTYNKRILSELACSPLPLLLRAGSFEAVDNLLLNCCGPGYSLAELGLRKEVFQ